MKTNKIFFALMLFSALVFTSCGEQENIQFDATNGQTLAKFSGSSASIPVNQVGVSSTSITVQVSTVSTSDRTVTITTDASSTATSDQYVMQPLIIPAGEYVASATVTGVYETLPVLGSVSLVLNLTGIDGAEAVTENNKFTISLERFCPLVIEDFYGTYAQLGGFNGGDPAPRGDVTISAGPAAGTLRLDDLYSTGRAGVIELDLSVPSSPKVIHRSEEFDVVFVVAGLGATYTEDVLGDVAKNTFNSCSKEIRLFFYRRIAQPDGRYYGGSYEIILNKK